jgi:hypothetical protein
MASLVGETVARNHVKAVETSKMGTRELAYFQVDMNVDAETNYTDSNSVYAQAIKGIQTVVEIYAVGKPNGQEFTVIAASDTAPRDSGDTIANGLRNSVIEAAINNATGASCRVFDGLLDGWSITNDC